MRVRVCSPMRNTRRTSPSHQASTGASAQTARGDRMSIFTSRQCKAALRFLTITITLPKIRIPRFLRVTDPLWPKNPSNPLSPSTPGPNMAPRSELTIRIPSTLGPNPHPRSKSITRMPYAAAACAWGCTACAPACRTASGCASSGCAGSSSGTVSLKIQTCKNCLQYSVTIQVVSNL